MKNLKPIKGKIITGVIVMGLALATPIIAAVTLNTFQAGETISSSAVNDNFSNLDQGLDDLQDQLDNLCTQVGQIRVSVVIESDGDLQPGFFSCNDAVITTSRVEAGRYELSVEGVADHRNLDVQVTPRNAGALFCTALQGINELTVKCWDEDGAAADLFFFVTLINVDRF